MILLQSFPIIDCQAPNTVSRPNGVIDQNLTRKYVTACQQWAKDLNVMVLQLGMVIWQADCKASTDDETEFSKQETGR